MPKVRRAHLSLVADQPRYPTGVVDEVRSARRDMARLLRALQASGRGIATWPDEVVTRLAHVDAVTARVLIERDEYSDAAAPAIAAMRTIECWVVGRLRRSELAEVRVFELMIRVDDVELEAPLLMPDRAPEDDMREGAVQVGSALRSLRGGLRALSDEELQSVCRRLGVRPLSIEPVGPAPARDSMELAVAKTLRDDHLLSILVATLSRETQELLAALMRASLTPDVVHRLATEPAVLNVAGGGQWSIGSPATQLRACGLAFVSTFDGRELMWVPVELQRRLDGVLRAFGV